jgi:hypothetical protein
MIQRSLHNFVALRHWIKSSVLEEKFVHVYFVAQKYLLRTIPDMISVAVACETGIKLAHGFAV